MVLAFWIVVDWLKTLKLRLTKGMRGFLQCVLMEGKEHVATNQFFINNQIFIACIYMEYISFRKQLKVTMRVSRV